MPQKICGVHKNGGTTMKCKKLVALLAAGAMVFSPAGMALGTPLEGVFASAVSAADAVDY